MTGHDAERAYVAARLDHLADRFDQARAEMQADLDRLRESWSGGVAQQLADHEDRVRRMREDHQAWLRSLYADYEGPQPTQDVGQGHGASATGPAPAPGPGPGQPSPPDEEIAQAIKTMSMAEYAQRRAEFGVRDATDMSRLFG
jgi:hypothetical protein